MASKLPHCPEIDGSNLAEKERKNKEERKKERKNKDRIIQHSYSNSRAKLFSLNWNYSKQLFIKQLFQTKNFSDA